MENGHPAKLGEKMSSGEFDNSISSRNSNDGSLFQVMKAVEAAEATIRQQVEENIRLRNELQKKIQELERYKMDEQVAQKFYTADSVNERVNGSHNSQLRVPTVSSLEENVRSMGITSPTYTLGTLVLHKDIKHDDEYYGLKSHEEISSGGNRMNGALKILPGEQASIDNDVHHRFSSPSTTAVSPARYQIEGEFDQQSNLPGHGLVQTTGVNNHGSILKQIQEHEEEIVQLRKHLANYSIKEAQIRNEKYVLEKRIAFMRLAFDQQQQDLVDAASKALSYRQDIIEENIRLTYELQAAQQERSTFVSSLMPLLEEYALQPPVPDAQSIVSNVRVLFRHLQEKLNITEARLKESQYQLTPWHSDGNRITLTQQSSHAVGNNGLELVPQPGYPHGKMPVRTPDAQRATEWEVPSQYPRDLTSGVGHNLEMEDIGRNSPLASRIPVAATGSDAPAVHSEETTSKRVIFRDPVSNSETDDPEVEGNLNEREPSANWGSGTSPYTTTLNDPSSSYSPYLSPVLEEPSSSFSEAADDDLLPAIEGLQISGEAFPGRELQASGYSINGTTSCNFEWVRHLEDGSVNYIEGAKKPNYLVTADDVDTYLVIEVQPLDDRKRKGELVKVFANDHRKITLDPEMQSHIEKTLYTGHGSYRVSLSTGYLDIWEAATLTIKREGCSVKCSGPNGFVITEKYSPATSVQVPYGQPFEFILTCSNGDQHLLRLDNSSMDVSCSRDTVVLTLRLFIIRAGEKRKGKKKGLFFNK